MNAEGKLSPEMSRIYFSPTRPMFELYDLEKDPREFDNLAGKKEAATIEHELKAVLAGMDDPRAGLPAAAHPCEPPGEPQIRRAASPLPHSGPRLLPPVIAPAGGHHVVI